MGATVSGTLFAHPTLPHQSPVCVRGWERKRDLVVVDGGLARWRPSDGNPFEQPIGIWLSWHRDGEPGVEVSATIGELSQIYLGTPDNPAVGETLVGVERVDKFPEPLFTAAGAFEPGGALITLTDLLLVEPTVEQVADFRVQQKRGRRTVHITARPAFFGPIVPHVGDRITVDLNDPLISVINQSTETGGLVTGVTAQVSEAVPSSMFTAYTRAQVGIPAADIDRDLFVVLVLDEPL
jgi:hypothetical protein